jgi:ribosome-interacting GTPase 1
MQIEFDSMGRPHINKFYWDREDKMDLIEMRVREEISIDMLEDLIQKERAYSIKLKNLRNEDQHILNALTPTKPNL